MTYAHSSFSHPSAHAAAVDPVETRRRLDTLARLLDSAVRVPGTRVTVGADAVLNLVPGVGTAFAKILAAYIVWEARRLGVPAGTLLRMTGNVAADLVFSAIPVVGWVGDIFFRANRRNMDLLRDHVDGLSAAAARPVGGGRSFDAAGREVVR